jgi:hypothetical protein
MTSLSENSSRLFARRNTEIAVWLVFLSLILVFGWHKSVENAREDLALREWTVRQAELSKEGDAEWRRLIAQFRSLQSKPDSQKTLEDELSGGAPFELRLLKGKNYRHHEGDEAIEWSHPKYGGITTLYFREGVLRGYGGGWGGQPESLHPRPTLNAGSNSAEWLRQLIARLGAYTWLIAIACWFAFSNRRLLAAQASLAAVLASSMAWLVNPHYSISWRGVFSNDNLFWAAAILLAFGPFGYVALLAGVATALVFAAFYYFFRVRDQLQF